MKIVVYRNSNSGKEKKKQSSIGKSTKIYWIKTSWWGDEALEKLFEVVNNNEGAQDLIIIGDAPAQSRADVDWKKDQRK